MGKDYDIMCAGHLCIDIIPRIPDTGAASLGELLRPGRLVNVEAAQLSTGGSVSNTGICMKVLGNSVCFSARVGDDDFGRVTVAHMARNGSADGITVVPGAASSYSIVLAAPGIDRVFLHNPGTNDAFCAEDVDAGLVGRCCHFHFGYPPIMRRMFEDGGRELRRIFEKAKAAGVTTSCDMSLPDPSSESGKADWRGILEQVLPYVDVFLPSIEECFFTLEPAAFADMRGVHPDTDIVAAIGLAHYSRLAETALALGCNVVVLKGGAEGIYLRSKPAAAIEAATGEFLSLDGANWGGRELWCPSFVAPRVLSATGAGDSAVGGFLTALLNGTTAEYALKVANCLGWQNVQALDSLSGLKSWAETERLLQGGLPMRDNRGLIGTGWRWDEATAVWRGPADRR
ncbi:MAG: carbohydrate kinase family protein [Kiritimatiellae bacterium]|nr:carbohydrate kinase family protein [Kiritimatiellia bacterium]